MTRILALLALTACTPTAAEWPEGRGAEPPAPVRHGQPEPNPPSEDWHGMPEPNPPSFKRGGS